MDIGTPGPALKATGVATSCDKSRQVATSCDKSRQVATSCDKLRPVGQDSLRGSRGIQVTFGRSRGIQDTLGGSWDLRETALDHHKTLSQGPGAFRALSEGPGTFRKQRQTIGNDSKMTEIMKIVEKWIQNGRNGLRIRPFEAHSHFQSIANPPGPQIPPENSQNPHCPKNRKIRKSGNPPGSAAMGGAPLIMFQLRFRLGLLDYT